MTYEQLIQRIKDHFEQAFDKVTWQEGWELFEYPEPTTEEKILIVLKSPEVMNASKLLMTAFIDSGLKTHIKAGLKFTGIKHSFQLIFRKTPDRTVEQYVTDYLAGEASTDMTWEELINLIQDYPGHIE